MEPNLASDVAQKVAWKSAPQMRDKLASVRCQVIHSLGALLQAASEVGQRRKVFEAQSKRFAEARENDLEKTDRVENPLGGNRYQRLDSLHYSGSAAQ